MTVCDLLNEFRENGSEKAFSEVVCRYTNLVYSAAKRRLSDDFLSQEATQIVFIRLAKAVPKLRTDAELVAWLHRTTLHVAVDLWRSESRRRMREEHAALMQTETHDATTWNDLAPVLDEALDTLNDADRQTILLRFFEQQTMHDVGVRLGVSEDAAKMRVSRALERLRRQFSARGITVAGTVLVGLLGERAVEAAPTQLTAALAKVKFATQASVSKSAGIRQLSAKLVAAGVAAIVTIALLLIPSQNTKPQSAGHVTNAAQLAAETSVPNEEKEVVAEKSEPDPRKLLQSVAEARQRIRSGSLTLDVFHEFMQRGHTETNQRKLTIVFDGVKRRFDSRGREYRYTSPGDAAEADEAKIREQGLDMKAAERAGFLEGFQAHVVMIYDRTVMFQYNESDGKPTGAVIDDPRKGSSYYLFDPHIFGLGSSYPMETLENCLLPPRSYSVQLIGQEAIEAAMTWHIRMKPPGGGFQRDIWIDISTPTRVVRYDCNGDTVLSTYYGTTADDPIPTEVHRIEFYGSERNRSETRFVRSRTQYNIEVVPAVWTLAGLQMKVGTPVSDIRISRRIGYWTGAGLSEDLPAKNAKPSPGPDRTELMALLEKEPASDVALKAATWILRNTPDGDDVEKAATVILQEHIRNPDLKLLAQELERLRHRSSTNLLTAMLEENPNREVQATACFGLGALFKEQWNNGANKIATAEAEKFFQRVVSEFSSEGKTGSELARRAERELHELRNLAIGQPAPETTGEDMSGRDLNLNAYRGNVVVLFFWSSSTISDLVEHNKVAGQLAGKPVSFIGINRDRDTARVKAALETNQISWPSFRDDHENGIFTTWNVDSWPTIIILDRNGVIRHRGLRSWDVAKAVDALLQE